ncbi:MAG: hypothetical protein FD148_3409 [Methylocystaceae bacterium]|nr:MAG: hypothetical protein FD148_3409 [Methylocystaceae bacterium]KAF0207093.1 MAG: hypothetical protein FD172_3751 [Methylocystaceae bacterium]
MLQDDQFFRLDVVEVGQRLEILAHVSSRKKSFEARPARRLRVAVASRHILRGNARVFPLKFMPVGAPVFRRFGRIQRFRRAAGRKELRGDFGGDARNLSIAQRIVRRSCLGSFLVCSRDRVTKRDFICRGFYVPLRRPQHLRGPRSAYRNPCRPYNPAALVRLTRNRSRFLWYRRVISGLAWPR